MYEAAAYSQNVLKVMVDPATWLAAAIFMFWIRRGWPLRLRIALALALNGVFILVWLVWPAGESGRYYAWMAFMQELIATALWCVIFIAARRLFGRQA